MQSQAIALPTSGGGLTREFTAIRRASSVLTLIKVLIGLRWINQQHLGRR